MFPVSSTVSSPQWPLPLAPQAEEFSLLSLLTGESLSTEQRVLYERVGQDYQQAITLAQYWLERARIVFASSEHQAGVSATSKLFLGHPTVPLDFEVLANALNNYLGTLRQEGNLQVVPDGFFARNPANAKSPGAVIAAYGQRSGGVAVNGDFHVGVSRSVKAAAMTLLHESTHHLGSKDVRYLNTDGQQASIHPLIDLAAALPQCAQRNAETWMMFIYALAQRGNMDEHSQQFCAQIDNWSLEFGQSGMLELRVLLEPFVVHLADSSLGCHEQSVMMDDPIGMDIQQLLHSDGFTTSSDDSSDVDFDMDLLDASPLQMQCQTLLEPVALSRLVQNCTASPGKTAGAQAIEQLAVALQRSAHQIVSAEHPDERASLAHTALQRLFAADGGLAERIAALHHQPGMLKPCMALLDVLQASLAVAPQLRDSARQCLGIDGRKPQGLAKLLRQEGNHGLGGDVRLRFDSLRQWLKRDLPISVPARALQSPSEYAQQLQCEARADALPSKPLTLNPWYVEQEQKRKDDKARSEMEAMQHLLNFTRKNEELARIRSETKTQAAIEARSRLAQERHEAVQLRRAHQQIINAQLAAQSYRDYAIAVNHQQSKKAIEQQARALRVAPPFEHHALPAANGSLIRPLDGARVDGVPVAALHSIDWDGRQPGNNRELAAQGLGGLVGARCEFDGTSAVGSVCVPVRVPTDNGLQTQRLSFAISASQPAAVAHRPFTANQLNAMRAPERLSGEPSPSRIPVLTHAGSGRLGAELEVISAAGQLRLVVPQARLSDEKGMELTLIKTNPFLRC